MNGIYNNIDIIPGDSQSSLVFLTAMTYFSLNDSITEYYYSDAFILKHLKFMNFFIYFFESRYSIRIFYIYSKDN